MSERSPTIGWFLPRSLLRVTARLRDPAVGCGTASLVGVGAGAAIYANEGTLRVALAATVLSFLAATIAVTSSATAARNELLAREGFPRFVRWWFTALADAWRSEGPTWTAISWGDRSPFGHAQRVHRVRVWSGESAKGDLSRWSTADGEQVAGEEMALDASHSVEVDRRLARMRDAGWPDVHLPAMCGSGRTPALWVFAKGALPRRRRADFLALGSPTPDARWAVEHAGLAGCHVLVRPGVGVGDARLGGSAEEVRTAVGAHWPVEEWRSEEGLPGLEWPSLGLAAAFDAEGRCVLLRATTPAQGTIVNSETGDRISEFAFGDDGCGGWASEALRRFRDTWPTTRQNGESIDVPCVGLRLLLDGAPASVPGAHATDSIMSGTALGALTALELHPVPRGG